MHYGGSKEASVDPLLDNDHGELGFDGRHASFEGREHLRHLMIDDELNLSITHTVAVYDNLFRIVVIGLEREE